MKRLTANRGRLLIVVGLLLALALLVTLLRGVARELIAVPLAYLLWLGRTFFDTVPQLLIWGWLLVVLGVLAFKSLTANSGYGLRDESASRPTRQERIAFWALQVNLAQRGSYYRARFSEFFGRLIVAVLAYARRANPAQFERDVKGGLVDLPPEVRPFVIIGGRSLRDPQHGWLANLRARVTRRPLGEDARASEQEIRLAVQFLEEQLEGKHEQRDQ